MISFEKIVTQIPNELEDVRECDSLAKKYLGWRKLDQEDLQVLSTLGQLETNKSSVNEVSAPEVDYWSPNSPINFAKYPYSGCEIYKHIFCPSFYLIYTEFGGHAPEKRCRLFLRSLIAE